MPTRRHSSTKLTFSPRSDNLSSQISRLSYPCNSHALHFVIPKSCHHHVIRPLTSMFALNPSTQSGNLLCLSILLEKTQHCAFLVSHEWYISQHHLYPVVKNRCHCLWYFFQRHFSSKLLCHKRRKLVPWVKLEKREVSRGFQIMSLVSSLIPISMGQLSLRSPMVGSQSHLTHNSLNYSYPLSLINTSSCLWLRGGTIEVLLCCWIDHLAQAIGEHREKSWSLWG